MNRGNGTRGFLAMAALLGLLASARISADERKPRPTDDLIADLGSGVAGVRIRAADELSRRKATEAIVPLIDVAGRDDVQLRVHAIRALTEIGSIDALPVLQAVADDKHSPGAVRAAAKKAVATFGALSPDQTSWVAHAREYVVINGKLVKISPVDLGYPSSRRIIAKEAPRQSNPSLITAERFASSLSDIKVGEFGCEPSCKVAQVLGPTDMLIQVPEYEPVGGVETPLTNVRVVGFDTKGIVDGSYWDGSQSGKIAPEYGPSIAIIGTTDNTDTSFTGRTSFLAVPMEVARRGLSFDQYKSLVIDAPPKSVGK